MKLKIEKMVYGGSGLAREVEGAEAGRTVFVPFTLPGEVVEARLTEEKGGFGEAVLERVEEASGDRVKPRCAHFGECGGCQYQHAGYAAQVAIKKDILLETLERAGLSDLPGVQVHTGEPWGYRNRIRLRVEMVEGELRVGYSRRGTNEFLAIVECPISAPLLWRAATSLLKVAMLDAAAGKVLARAEEVEFFCAGDEMRLQMTLFARPGNGVEQRTGFERLCTGLRMLVPELSGGGWMTSAGKRGVPKPLAKWGAEGLEYEAAGRGYWVSRGGFFQVNRWMVDELVRVVTEGRSGMVAWDLYAGVGLFSRVLAANFAVVVSVEASHVAAMDLRRALPKLGVQHKGVEGSVVEFLRGAVVQRERPELVVMDPPRAGVGAEVCDLLARVSAREMVYVSCDPVTLGRDLKALVDSGYTLVELHMVDLFPQTFHLESVAVLRK